MDNVEYDKYVLPLLNKLLKMEPEVEHLRKELEEYKTTKSTLEQEVEHLKKELQEYKTTKSTLEQEVEHLKKELQECNTTKSQSKQKKEAGSDNKTVRDSTKYILDNTKYGKNRLVLAIVKKYVSMNSEISAEELMNVFDKSLQGSLGVIRTLEDVQQKYGEDECKIRFFTADDEIIHTSTKDCVVCTQWNKDNIGNILSYAQQLGMKIEEKK